LPPTLKFKSVGNLKVASLIICLEIFSIIFGQEEEEEERDWVAFSQSLKLGVNKNLDFELIVSGL
jgi:hypothetical protein